MPRCAPTVWHKLLRQVTPALWHRGLHKAAPANEQFVVCGVQIDNASHGRLWGPKAKEIKFGVNYAVHKHINALEFHHQNNTKAESLPEKCQFDKPTMLKGILKGCAEQNALGVLAASGVPYASIRKIFILALEPRSVAARAPSTSLDEFTQELHAMLCGPHSLAKPENTPFLPCQACASHLNAIGHCVQKCATDRKNGVIDVFTMQNLNARSVRHVRFPQDKL